MRWAVVNSVLASKVLPRNSSDFPRPNALLYHKSILGNGPTEGNMDLKPWKMSLLEAAPL